MIKNKRSRKPRTLELKSETIVRLTETMLSNVVGGVAQKNSVHLSMCDAPCESW
jgi:hypothetical protein